MIEKPYARPSASSIRARDGGRRLPADAGRELRQDHTENVLRWIRQRDERLLPGKR